MTWTKEEINILTTTATIRNIEAGKRLQDTIKQFELTLETELQRDFPKTFSVNEVGYIRNKIQDSELIRL
jgi:hypothetical protein